ncbi:MAG: cyclic nucleotide-binding domain-containing protein [Cellulosilyticum sp.]|nr:cyclic nucleotide-binding domain-containing protein [Cellulosilyticum sp.]
MERIDDLGRVESYYLKYEMSQLFDSDLLQAFELIKVNRLDYICTQEEPLEYVCFLVEGRAKVVKALANGKTLLLSFYEPFEVIGDVEIIKAMPAVCTVQALEQCYLLALPIDKVRAVLKKDIKFLNFICNVLSKKIDYISHSSSINLLYPLENRLANYIDKTSTLVNDDRGGRCFSENLTQLAELLGISYRHLLRTLNGLCQAEILERRKEGYRITNEEQLRKLAEALYK